MKPIPNTLEELSKLEQVVAQRMSALNAISNSLNEEIHTQMKGGFHIRAKNTLTRKNSLKNDIGQLSKKLMEIQRKRDELIATHALH